MCLYTDTVGGEHQINLARQQQAESRVSLRKHKYILREYILTGSKYNNSFNNYIQIVIAY